MVLFDYLITYTGIRTKDCNFIILYYHDREQPWADPEGVGGIPLKNHKNRVSLHYWSGPSENHKANKQAFNVGPSSVRQRNAMEMAFRWRADDGPSIAYMDPRFPHQHKKKDYRILTPLTKLSGSAHDNGDADQTVHGVAPQKTSINIWAASGVSDHVRLKLVC